ncbi:MAG TPA: methylenetetrahydrofolate reductase [NAD(P)H] [Elusimicrobia bacterium]|nr:MAG: methylenetetrahydrofolate reductase [NAD(P)H] [Elusimicrobia bacterium GWA2_66_18]HAZ07623.1 methylenetetrahydrofolate reductase [NAD(P)H] [Elusimicrobiota bacterium]
MDIPELLAATERPLFSFEFFLPKAPEDLDAFVAFVRELKDLSPDYVTLTYGAGGSARERTIEIAGRLQRETGLTTVSHLTCIAHTRAEISAILLRLEALGIRHIVALRGDAPKDAALRPVEERDFAHAVDLVRHLRERGGLRTAVAAYPEKHPESPSPEEDLRRFAEKVAAGGDWAVTQLFFDARDYFAFVRRAREAGVKVPIVPGIMPVTGYPQLKRFVGLCGARIPPELDERLSAIQHDSQAVVAFGVDWAVRQCRALLDGGAPGIHFYTLNRSHSTAEILSRLRRP